MLKSQPSNHTEVRARPGTLFDLIADAASRHPERPAVKHRDSTIDYRSLLRLSASIGSGLVGLCPSPSRLVGVYMERSIGLVAGLLAAHRTGNAFVPMDPSLPDRRLSHILANARPDVILTERQLSSWAAHQEIPFLSVEDLVNATEDDTAPVALLASANSAAYVIYTSGSSGEPKGVEIRQDGIMNQILWRKQRFQIQCEDRILQAFSLAFDPSIWEIFGTLEAGACVVISDEMLDASRIARSVHDEGITVMQTVPSMLKQLLAQPEFRASSCLRHVICGGEVLEQDTVRRFYETFGSAHLHNLYGPTEAAIDATSWTCSPQDLGDRVPIGFPIAHTQVILLDDAGEMVPVGESGEIYVAGPGVGNGYYRKPKLTAERFIQRPTTQNGTVTYFRTGDRGVVRDDGALEFLGRLDRQIKIRGYRVEPAEVESALVGHSAVDEAVVVARSEAKQAAVLVAYVVPASDGSTIVQQHLRDHIAALLPDYMVPAIVVALPKLPRNSANKVDLSALPEPGGSPQSRSDSVSLWSPTEQRAAEIWCQILNVESLDPDANFFELGGDSLALSSCIAKLEAACGRRINPGEFFTRSFRQIAAMLDSHD